MKKEKYLFLSSCGSAGHLYAHGCVLRMSVRKIFIVDSETVVSGRKSRVIKSLLIPVSFSYILFGVLKVALEVEIDF